MNKEEQPPERGREGGTDHRERAGQGAGREQRAQDPLGFLGLFSGASQCPQPLGEPLPVFTETRTNPGLPELA